MRRLVCTALTLGVVCGVDGGWASKRDAANTDATDCQTCRELTFCSEFSGREAADCQGDDEEEDAEDKWENRVGDDCNGGAYKQHVCVRKMDPCSAQHKVVHPCQTTCTAAKSRCEGKSPVDAVKACKRHPTSHCWEASFDKCDGRCEGLAHCKVFNGFTSVGTCDERSAVATYDQFINAEQGGAQAQRRFTKRCPEAFFNAYVCHTALRPCTQEGVNQRPCFDDCWRFQHHCLGHTRSMADELCTQHASFYCDSIDSFTAKRDPSALARAEHLSREGVDITNQALLYGVAALCVVQVIALRVMGSGSRPDIIMQRIRRRVAGARDVHTVQMAR